MSEKKRFKYYGTLPACFEDFITEGDYPNFTIVTKSEAEADEQSTINDDADDRWIDIIVDAPEITEALARELIAKHFGVSEDLIELRETGFGCDICGGRDC